MMGAPYYCRSDRRQVSTLQPNSSETARVRRKALDYFLMGSASEAVARHAHCSVQMALIPQGPVPRNRLVERTR